MESSHNLNRKIAAFARCQLAASHVATNTLARQKLRFLMSVTPNPFPVES